MNPLTQVKNTQKITAREAAAGVSDEGSWHAVYKDSAYIFVGGLPFDLTEGDLLAIFAQYGEIVDVNLVRNKSTGKSQGFAFLAYEDQRSTVLAVDNLNGATVVGRILRVDHVANYKRKVEEDEEEEQKKREERGVCYAFQRGECNRGSACKFSHDEKRNADTGWGSKHDGPRWGHDKYEGANLKDSTRKETDDSRRDADKKLRESDRRETDERSRGARRDDVLYSRSGRDDDQKSQKVRVDHERRYYDRERDDDEKSQKARGNDERRFHDRGRDDVEDARDSEKIRKTDIGRHFDRSENSDKEEFRRFEDHHKRTVEFKRPRDVTDKRDDRREHYNGKESKLSRR